MATVAIVARNAAKLAEVAAGIRGLGGKVEEFPSDVSKAESVTALTKGVEFLMKKNKVDWIKGWGAITGPGKVEVKGDGAQTLEARNIIIATGSEPTPLPGVEVDNKRILDSTGALSIPEVPKSMVIIGAGIIGLELGSVWRRLGAEVTVVEFLPRITPGMDEEVAKTFQRALTKQGMSFKLGAKVTAAKASAKGVEVTVEPVAGGAAETLKADYVLVAIGRRPYTKDLGLDSVGIALDKRGRFGAAGTGTGFEYSVTCGAFSKVVQSPGLTSADIGPLGGNRK